MKHPLAAIREWLGVDLPARNLDLRFEMLHRWRRGKRPPLTPERVRESLARHRTTPEEHLRELNAIAGNLNRWPLGEEKHMVLLECLAKEFYIASAPLILQLMQASGGIPEPPERRETFELHDRCATALLDGYRSVFAQDYQRHPFFYRRIRPRIYRCACRILELVKHRQRLAGARYLRLDPTAWRTAHTVFAAMWTCEPVDDGLDTLSRHDQSLDRRAHASLRQHYVSLATYDLLDYVAWPELDQIGLDAYVGAEPDAIRLRDFDPQLDPRPWYLYTHCYSEGPPSPQPPADLLSGPTLMLDHHNLAACIRADLKGMDEARARGDNFRTPPRLLRIATERRTAFCFLLQRNLREAADWAENEAEPAKHRDLRIYAGFQEVREHLSYLFRRDDGRLRQGHELSDLFARRSAVIGEDETAPQHSLWFVLQDTRGRLLIRTQETRFTNRMQIGNLLAYGFGEAQAQAPRIGKVNRVLRPAAGLVLLDIDDLASFATPARLFALSDAAAARADDPTAPPLVAGDLTGEPLASLLSRAERGSWGLLTPPQTTLRPGEIVGIKTGSRLTRARVGTLDDVTVEFCRFTVTSAGFPTQPPSYPAPAKTGDPSIAPEATAGQS